MERASWERSIGQFLFSGSSAIGPFFTSGKMTRSKCSIMADFFVIALSTLTILLLSYMFWKWNTQRNNLLTNKSNKRPIMSRADMLKNRLKKFDSSGGDASGIMGSEKESMGKEPIVFGSYLGNFENKKNTGSGTGINLQGHSSTKVEAKYTAEKPASISRPTNLRKWVTLSISDTDDKSDPVTQPLTSLEELWIWTEGYDELNVSSVTLHRVTNTLEQQPRTLVCHDMKGGYVQDRFVQGYPSTDCYRIYHWQHIDIFVYFSHNFITIPPPCWTNAAHKHGVLVLGTFITEWQDGAVQCAKMFKDRLSYQRVADQLVVIAKYYRFEGWLINIENPIQPAQMSNLVEFMKYLTDEMHKAVPGSLIIWYDSVTYKGELKWQNILNSENRVFFDVSDGIFLNYGWNQTDLALSGRAAGNERRYDVYVGVDVFGRGVFGGGGWNTNKATHVIKTNDLSIALFAPGWVYEKFESTFKVSQDKFWTSIASDCSTHGLGPCLLFVTSFCQGYGEKWFSNGKVVLDHPWTHLSAQQLQPSYLNQIYSLGNQHGVLITTIDHQIQDAYRGGGCFVLQGSTKAITTPSKAVVRLFKTDILLPRTVLISFTFKVDASIPLDIAVQLHVDKKPNYIMLCPVAEDNTQESEKLDNLNKGLMQRYGVPRSGQIDSGGFAAISVGQEHYRSFLPVTGDYHDKLAEMCCDAEENKDLLWCTRYYLLAEKDLKDSRIKEIRLVLMNRTKSGTENSSSPFQLYLGEVKIIDAVSLRRPLPTVTSLKCLESAIKSRVVNPSTIAITLTLSWSYDSSKTEPWEKFHIYRLDADGSAVFLGLAFALSFVVCDLAIPRSQKETRFTVQAVSCCQRKQALQDCPVITVHWS